MAHAAGSKSKTLGAVVPLNTYTLAIEQAHKEGKTVSHLCAEIIKKYLRKKGTVIVA